MREHVKLVKAAKHEPEVAAPAVAPEAPVVVTAPVAVVPTEVAPVPAGEAPRRLRLPMGSALYHQLQKTTVTREELLAVGRSPEGCVKVGYAFWVE